ncbi:C10 family peptidase [Candidatus Zixiibacteriota bacterium]
MRKYVISIVIASLGIIGAISPSQAQMVSRDDARTLASGWIDVIIQSKGNWGGAEVAEVADVQEFRRGNRVLGYFCRVRPQGYVVISLRKELVPVKAYSATGDLEPWLDEGMADLIKGGMEQVLDHIERRLGPVGDVRTAELVTVIDVDYWPTWEELERGGLKINYQEGDILLTSSWSQGFPYNVDCPGPPDGDDCTASFCFVGCVATAGAQIMRYWNWPPYGVGSPYDDAIAWRNMPDTLDTNSPQALVDAVAELCHEVGMAVGMDYCEGVSHPCASRSQTEDMIGVYEDHYHYHDDCSKRNRNDYSAVDWFELMKIDLNINRPVQYRVENHSIVADGWQEIGGVPLRQYHMNYGWDNNSTTWYSLDSLYLGGVDEEFMLIGIYPAQSMHNYIEDGTYPRESFPYRYFDRDISGNNATFESGQHLQFMPNIRLECTSTTGGSIRFYGSSSYHTHLFTRGDASEGVLIYDGAVKLNRYGGIKFY